MDAKKKIARKNLAKSAAGSARRAADIVDPSKIVRELGDHIDTRFKGGVSVDDLDADVHGTELINEAKIRSGDRARAVAADLKAFVSSHEAQRKVIGHNRNAVTCVALYKSFVVYGDKAGCVVVADFLGAAFGKWPLAPAVPGGVFSVAVSDTPMSLGHNMGLERTTVDVSVASYIAAGGGDGSIQIWNTLTRAHLGSLHMHRAPVTGLVFRMNSAMLLSSSADSTLRVWSVPEMHAVDKFFGHLGKVNAVSALRKERAATAGDDGSTRYWKLEAATQMEFQRCETPTEAVAMLNDQTVACAALDGSLRLFDINKRSAIAAVEVAHGAGVIGDGTGLEAEAVRVAAQQGRALTSGAPNGICALAATPFGDVVATGSCCGSVRLWRAEGYRSDGKSQPVLEPVGELPCAGFVNGLAFSADFDFIAVAAAKEPRLGRWRTIGSALNAVIVFAISPSGCQQLAASGRPVAAPALAVGSSDATIRPTALRSKIDEEVDNDEDDGMASAQTSAFAVHSDGRLVFKAPASAGTTKVAVVARRKGKAAGLRAERRVPITRRGLLGGKTKKATKVKRLNQ
jgi:ribosomal RNA-processing protein 9